MFINWQINKFEKFNLLQFLVNNSGGRLFLIKHINKYGKQVCFKFKYEPAILDANRLDEHAKVLE